MNSDGAMIDEIGPNARFRLKTNLKTNVTLACRIPHKWTTSSQGHRVQIMWNVRSKDPNYYIWYPRVIPFSRNMLSLLVINLSHCLCLKYQWWWWWERWWQREWWWCAAQNSWAMELLWLDLNLGPVTMMATRSSSSKSLLQSSSSSSSLSSPPSPPSSSSSSSRWQGGDHQNRNCHVINLITGYDQNDNQGSCCNNDNCDVWCHLGSGEVRSWRGGRGGGWEKGKKATKLSQIRLETLDRDLNFTFETKKVKRQ